MIEVLLFSFSISIDAFGYALGFGTRQIKLSKLEFLIFNLINTIILTIMVLAFSFLGFLLNNPIVEMLSAFALIIFGLFYVFSAFKDILKELKNNSHKQGPKLCRLHDYFKSTDLLLILCVFVFENAFSSLVFYASMSNAYLFILSNFLFHYIFFIIGFDLGAKIVNKININTSFISGLIFLILGLVNLI